MNGCDCDLCTGKRSLDDNWCARCDEVKMQPPKRWENLDICDECEREVGPDGDATTPPPFPEPRIARGDS